MTIEHLAPLNIETAVNNGGATSAGILSPAEINAIRDSINGIVSRFNSDVIDRVTNDHYSFTQDVAATTWSINHRLNRAVNVIAYDNAGRHIIGQLSTLDTNTIEIKFNSAVAGTAEIR